MSLPSWSHTPWVGVALGVLVVAMIGVLVFWEPSERRAPLAEKKEKEATADAQTALTPQAAEEGYEIVGGVKRPRTDLGLKPEQSPQRPQAGAGQAQDEAKAQSEDPFNYGTTPPVAPDANVHVKSVVEAIRNKTNPERVSVLIQPKAFDAEAYQRDPGAYLNVVEPGRVFQSAEPSEATPRIRPVSPYFQEVAQGDFVELKVSSVPKMPVTFTSFDLGRFENQLTSMTVEADGQGIAQVKFYGISGTINDVNILAASPVASGQVKFVVNVTKPVAGR